MYRDFEDRAVKLGRYIAESKSTVRGAAKKFGVSKSTVHSDVTVRLRKIDPSLFSEVRKVLDVNKEERHIRGGIATREKYRRETVASKL
jgi:putative DeoR family transcriptional regulator (stage III sporulation protein D)